MTVFSPDQGGWQFRAYGDTQFHRDEIRIFLGRRVDGGFQVASEAKFEFGETFDPMVAQVDDPQPFLVVPTEAAEAMFNALAIQLLGRDGATLLQDNRRLRCELEEERKRVDNLIAGIGKGVGATGATAPGGTHPLPKDARPDGYPEARTL